MKVLFLLCTLMASAVKCEVQMVVGGVMEGSGDDDNGTAFLNDPEVIAERSFLPTCPPGRCLNGGTCYYSNGRFSCNCRPGYSGDQCTGLPCELTCSNGRCDGGKCVCKPGFTGTPPNCVESRIDPCASNPCYPSECVNTGRSSYSCLPTCEPNPCPVGQKCRVIPGGHQCDKVIDPCSNNPCPTNMRCILYDDRVSYYCRLIVSPCNNNACPLGQKCIEIGSSYNCVPISPCSSNPCPSGQQCTAIDGSSYNCVSTPPCSRNPCPLGQKCVRTGIQTYSCASPCSSNPCLSGQRCVESGTSHRCVLTNPCSSNPCPFDQECYSIGSSYRCQDGANVCATNPCKNGCVCQSSCRRAEGYYCKSENSLYTGKNCDIPMPTIGCSSDQMTVVASSALVQQFGNVNTMQLVIGEQQYQRGPVNPMCILRNGNGNSYSITAMLNTRQCGVAQARTGNGMMTYTTTLWLRMIYNGDFDMPVPIAILVCTYQPEFTVSTSLQPKIDLPQTITGKGEIATQGSISLCKKQDSCPKVCPVEFQVNGQAVYVVGEMLHLNIQTGTNNPQQKAAIEQLFISCSNQKSAPPVVSLVNVGCPATYASNYVETQITFNAQTDCVCVSFRVPRLLNCDKVYVHAKLSDCGNKPTTTCSNSGSSSVRTCVPRTLGRRRRSAANETTTRIFGPLFFVDLGDGKPKTIMYPGKELVPIEAVLPVELQEEIKPDLPRLEEDSTSPSSTIALIVAAFIFILCILFACFVLYRTCYFQL